MRCRPLDELGLLLERVTRLKVKKSKIRVTESAPADNSHKYTANSLRNASNQHPHLKPETSIEAEQIVAPQVMGPYSKLDTSKFESSESGQKLDCDYNRRKFYLTRAEAERASLLL